MSQAYSNPDRESDPHSLPDVEVFHIEHKQYSWQHRLSPSDDTGQQLDTGWYWWSCFPGCLPDSDPNGPFETKALALADAQSHND